MRARGGLHLHGARAAGEPPRGAEAGHAGLWGLAVRTGGPGGGAWRRGASDKAGHPPGDLGAVERLEETLENVREVARGNYAGACP